MYQPTAIAKVNFNGPTIKLEQAETSLAAQTRHRPSTNDIPQEYRTVWVDVVLPYFRDFLGTLEDPWNTDDPRIILNLQDSYDYAIDDGHIIVPLDPIYTLVSTPKVVRHSNDIFYSTNFRRFSASMNGEGGLLLLRSLP